MARRAKEGYLLIDNRNAPAGIMLSGVIDPGVTVYESATYTCSHCHAIVVMNPQRTRERHWCWSCDHVVCDVCAEIRTTQPCRPMARIIEEGQTRAVRALREG